MGSSYLDAAEQAVEHALALGARYADARVMVTKTESMAAQNGVVERLQQDETAGVGVRALVGSSWGFFATPHADRAPAAEAGRRAVETPRASASSRARTWPSPTSGGDGPLVASLGERVPGGPARGAAVGEGRPAGRRSRSHARCRRHDRAGLVLVWDTRKWFVSSEGHRIDQHIRECGAWIRRPRSASTRPSAAPTPASAASSAPAAGSRSASSTSPATPLRLADEAQALLTAPACPSGETTLILGANQMALQLHESVGHATELDRILGWEAAFAGTSWLELAQMGSLRFGSPLMNVVADASLPGGLGSFGYDDEGTPAHRVDIVKDGLWVGVLSGRDSAALAGIPSGGCVRADGFNRLPMVRMTNIGLLPGDSSLEEMIADTDDGILMDTNRSWSIDDRRLNFQFGCEIGYEVKNGKRGRMLRNPTYTGISPHFWGSMDRVGGPDELVVMGTPNCGKGQPLQVGHTGHPTVPGRFQSVRVGVSG